LANYNDWPRCWELNSPSFQVGPGGGSELNSLSLCILHLFRVMCGDGEETKQCTLDLLLIESSRWACSFKRRCVSFRVTVWGSRFDCIVLFYMEIGCSAMVIFIFIFKNRQFWFCHKFFESADQKSNLSFCKEQNFHKTWGRRWKSYSRICRYNFCFVVHDIQKAWGL